MTDTFFDYDDETKEDIIKKAAKEANEDQAALVDRDRRTKLAVEVLSSKDQSTAEEDSLDKYIYAIAHVIFGELELD